MKNLESQKNGNPTENNRRPGNVKKASEGKRRKRRSYVQAKTKAPTSTSPELAILSILSRSPTSGIRTYEVLKEVRTKWFSELSPVDNRAVYQESKKNIVDSVIKFAKKHLITKGQVFPPGTENPVGVWRITSLGVERALKETGNWMPKYTEVHSMIEVDDYETL